MLYTGPVSCCTLDLYHVASTCCRDLSLKHPDQHVYTGVGPCWYMLIRYWEELAVYNRKDNEQRPGAQLGKLTTGGTRPFTFIGPASLALSF